MFNSTSARHVKRALIRKSTSIGLTGLLVSASLVGLVTASQGAPSVVTDIYCGQHSMQFGDPEINGDLVPYEFEGENVAVFDVPVNDFLLQWFEERSLREESVITFADTSEVVASEIAMLYDSDPEMTPLAVRFTIPLAETKLAVETWPVTLTHNFDPTTDVGNSVTSIRDFKPCSGYLDEGETENLSDAFDGFGSIAVLGEAETYNTIYADTPSKSVVRKSVLDGVTTFSFDTERYSAAADAEVNINVNVKFAGNTITWTVQAFDLDTSEPAALTFYIPGDLGSDSGTETFTSNNLTYNTDRFNEDPILVFATDSGMTTRITEDLVRFSGENLNTGFVEVTLIGFDRCATQAEIVAEIDSFTSAYAENKNTDIPDVVGAACERVCQPLTATLERTPGVFDLGGIPLCFDTAFESNDLSIPQTLVEQEIPGTNIPDLGSNMELGDYVDYQNVVEGADVILNATVTVSTLYLQQDNEIDDVDDGEFRNNAWINSDIDYEEGEEDRYIELTIEFYVSGDVSRTAVRVSNLGLDVYDIDNGQFFGANGVDTYSLAEDTILEASASGAQLRVSENNGEPSSNGEESRASVSFKPANSFVLRLGMTGLDDGSGGASYGLDFTGLTGWESAPVEEEFKPGRGSTGSVEALPAPTTKFVAKRTINGFFPESPRLLKAQKAIIRTFLKKNPEITNLSCTGYTAGPVKNRHMALAKKRASNVCAYIEKIRPGADTKVAAKTLGLPLSPLSRKVVIRGSSVNP